MTIQDALRSWANTFLSTQVDSYDQFSDGTAIAFIVDQMYVLRHIFVVCIVVCSGSKNNLHPFFSFQHTSVTKANPMHDQTSLL